MIVLNREQLIPIRDAPGHLPARRSGKRVHVSACYRWVSRGVRGVRLETIKVGGSTYTSAEALQRFAERLSRDRRVDKVPAGGPASRRRAMERAARLVEIELGLVPDRL